MYRGLYFRIKIKCMIEIFWDRAFPLLLGFLSIYFCDFVVVCMSEAYRVAFLSSRDRYKYMPNRV